MYSGSFKGAVLLDRPMLLFSTDNDPLCVLLNSIIPQKTHRPSTDLPMSEDMISEDSIHDFLKLLGTHVLYPWNIHHGFSTCFPCGVQVVILPRYRTIKKPKLNIILFYLTYS
jgi:hypothetical protein